MKTSSSFATIIALLGIVASPYAGGAQDEEQQGEGYRD